MSLDLTTTKNDASHLIYEKPTLDIKKLDSIDMMKDVLSGDTDLLARWEANLDAMGGIETLQTALKWLQEADPYGDYKQLIANEGWRLTYRRRPPTPEEFLTYEWIGPQCEALWPNIKKCFIEFLDPNPLNPARNMALSTSIGWGKQNPISSKVMTNKKIKIELEDGSIEEFESDEMVDVIIEGNSTKIQANELLKMDLSKCMKIKSVTCEYISKPLKELQIGDRVLGVNGDRPKILNIQKNGVQPTFTIKLSDGRSFRAGKGHFNTVHFRNSKLRPDKKVYDVLTVEYIKNHLNEYLFEIPTDDTFNLSEIDFWQHLEMLPCHENEPVDREDIIPDFNRDPNKVYIESIVPDGDEECWCLQLNDPLGLFAIEDRIFTHNSLLTNLILSYIIVLFGLMRKPYQLLGHSPMTAYSVGMCSATLNKAWDLLGVPFEQLIEQSPFFEKVGRHDDIVRVNEEDKECSKCYYTTAARGSAKMVFRNNLQLKLVSTEGALLGNAQPMYSKIMKSDGTYYEMRDVQLGDKIKSPTEGETEVIGIFPQGERDIFEIELEDGRKVRSSDNHLWKVAIDKNKKGEWNWQVVNTLQLIDWLKKGKEIEIYDESNAPEVRL